MVSGVCMFDGECVCVHVAIRRNLGVKKGAYVHRMAWAICAQLWMIKIKQFALHKLELIHAWNVCIARYV
jgi:hypothetical protein